MTTIRTFLAMCLVATALAGCSPTDEVDEADGADVGDQAGAQATAGGGDGDASAEPVDGGTFRMSMAGDPGALDPHLSADGGLLQLSQLAYDPLLGLDAADGTVVSGLATDWEVSDESVELTLGEGITCADGTPFTAGDAAANLNFVTDPANGSPFLGTFVPAGATATGDDASGTVTLALAAPAPFVLQGLAVLPMVCAAGLEDRSSLTGQAFGTGPYELTEAVPEDHYTFAIREGYTWGPGGATTDEPGMPDTVVVQVVPNATTAANLLLAGDLNAAQIIGPEAGRVSASDLFVSEDSAVIGEMWFNHAEGRPTADVEVRRALTHALDLAELRAVLTSDAGEPPTAFAIAAPAACPGGSLADALPDFDPDLAAELLDEAGWQEGPDGVRERDGQPLEVQLLLDNALGPGGTAAAELAVQQWRAVGVDASSTAQDGSALQEVVFSGGDWDAVLLPLNVSSPDQLVSFLSGPAAPEGTNFAGISNEAYEAGVAEATQTTGQEGCDTWLAAEAHLVADADVIPFANQVVPTFGNGATFETSGQIHPTSIRMVAS